MAEAPERYSPPIVIFPLARSRGVAVFLWGAWTWVGLSTLLALAWLLKLGLLNSIEQQDNQWLGMGLGFFAWCGSFVAIAFYLRTDRWRQAVLCHRVGRWSIQNRPNAPELPVEVHLYIDMQRWLLVRLKDDSAWHWLWLRDNTSTQTQSLVLRPPDLAWQNLRQALVASRALR